MLVNIHMVLAVLLVAAMTAVVMHLKAPLHAVADRAPRLIAAFIGPHTRSGTRPGERLTDAALPRLTSHKEHSPMTTRPSLLRSIPFWILLVGSLATAAVGAWLTVDKLAVMSVGLTAGTATPVDVYVGQVWAIIGGILLATGILGLALALVTRRRSARSSL